nr:MAG TPA: hypothetical protein [Caudoviricetes sp.]
MAKLVDAQVSKTCEKSCGFESHYQHHKTIKIASNVRLFILLAFLYISRD